MVKKLILQWTGLHNLRKTKKTCKLAYHRNGEPFRDFEKYALSDKYLAVPVIASGSSEIIEEPEFEYFKHLDFDNDESYFLRKTACLFWERARKISNRVFYKNFREIQPNPLNEKFAFAFGYAFLPINKQKNVKIRHRPVGIQGNGYREVIITVEKSSTIDSGFDELLINGLEELEEKAIQEYCDTIGKIIIEPMIFHEKYDERTIKASLQMICTGYKYTAQESQNSV